MPVVWILSCYECVWLVVLVDKKRQETGESIIFIAHRVDYYFSNCVWWIRDFVLISVLPDGFGSPSMGCLGKCNGVGRHVASGKKKNRKLVAIEYLERIRHSIVVLQSVASAGLVNNFLVRRRLHRIF